MHVIDVLTASLATITLEPVASRTAPLRARTFVAIEGALSETIPIELTDLMARYVSDPVADHLPTCSSNADLVTAAARYSTRELALLDLSNRSNLDDATLEIMLRAFPAITELNIRNCPQAGFRLFYGIECPETVRTLRIANSSAKNFGDMNAIDGFTRFFTSRGVTIDDTLPGDYTKQGLLGLIINYDLSELKAPGETIASAPFKEALRTGSWTPADVVLVINSESLIFANALFTAPQFDCNLALDAEGHTALDLLQRKYGEKLAVRERMSTTLKNKDPLLDPEINAALELLRSRGAKTKEELVREAAAASSSQVMSAATGEITPLTQLEIVQ